MLPEECDGAGDRLPSDRGWRPPGTSRRWVSGLLEATVSDFGCSVEALPARSDSVSCVTWGVLDVLLAIDSSSGPTIQEASSDDAKGLCFRRRFPVAFPAMVVTMNGLQAENRRMKDTSQLGW